MEFFVTTFIIVNTLVFSSTALSQVTKNNPSDSINDAFNIYINESSFSSVPEALTKSHDHHFDFLMFTQLWPISNCIDWEERDHDNTCSLNDDFQWTVHGIWPTKKHTKGPFHCKNIPFNETAVAPILKDLEKRWLNVRNGTGEYDFWKHEWSKHGTCAVQIKQMNTEIKYFKKGLDWQKEYDMHKILLESGITPGGQYRATNIVESVGKYLGSKANKTNINPAITCRKEKGYQNHLIFELVVCFDKQLNLTNCDDVAAGIYGEGNSLCPHEKDSHYIVYPQDPDLGWNMTRHVMIIASCFLIFGLCFVGGLYRGRSRFGPPRNGCCWNRCYLCGGNDDDYVHPFITDNFKNKNNYQSI